MIKDTLIWLFKVLFIFILLALTFGFGIIAVACHLCLNNVYYELFWLGEIMFLPAGILGLEFYLVDLSKQ